MAQMFRVLTTPAFEREYRALSRKHPSLIGALEELLEILGEDPHHRSGRYQIKKLAGLKAGKGQGPVWWREHRLRYDISGSEVVPHSFRHRKDAY